MKQNKKGFTLIELLAVIVILAIIALIAVPVIMNIISSARKSAFEDTAYGIIKSGELYYASALLNDGMTSDAEFTFNNGAVSPEGLSVQGSLPQSGKLVVTTDGKTAIAISNGTYCITKGYDESKITTTEEFETCGLPAEPAKTLKDLAKTNDFATSVNACATTGTCAVGTKFAIEVAPGDIKNFYVVSDADNTVTLIMDRNVGDTVAWNTSGNKEDGPITALNYLESQTAGWTNIEVKDYTVADENNPKIYSDILRTNARARMLTQTEADTLIGANSWIYGNLNSWDESTGPYGYWTSSADADAPGYAWGVDYDGNVDTGDVYYGDGFGVRPVIEILKSNI